MAERSTRKRRLRIVAEMNPEPPRVVMPTDRYAMTPTCELCGSTRAKLTRDTWASTGWVCTNEKQCQRRYRAQVVIPS